MTTKKQPKAKPLTKLQQLERENAILTQALYMQYDDIDNFLGMLGLIIDEAEKPEPNRYRLRHALQAYRTLVIANQSLMMDCAGLEY